MFTGEPLSEKSKLVAGLLQIFLGTLGIGRFYMGSTGVGVAQLVVWLLGIVTLVFGIGFLLIVGVWIWSVVDGIILLSGRPRDGAGLLMR
jgi:TM2 domain-containing membrane protein YozV